MLLCFVFSHFEINIFEANAASVAFMAMEEPRLPFNISVRLIYLDQVDIFFIALDSQI